MKSTVEKANISNQIIELCKSEEKLKKHLTQVLNKRKPKQFIYKNTESKSAAVLLPIFFKNGEAHLLFTKRTDYVEHHKGQISFPGGSRDLEDVDLKTTALRETEEEVGISNKDVEVIGQTDIFLTNTHFLVTPFVGFYKYPYPYQINEDEISRLIEVPLLHFFNEEIFEVKSYEREGYNWLVHFYHYGDDMIWGVTGFLMSNFLSIVFEMDRNFFSEPSF